MDLIRFKILIPTITNLHRQINSNFLPLLKFKNIQTITWKIGSTENQRMRYSQFWLEVVKHRQRQYRRRQRKKRVRAGITVATGLLQDSLLRIWQVGLSKIITMSQVRILLKEHNLSHKLIDRYLKWSQWRWAKHPCPKTRTWISLWHSWLSRLLEFMGRNFKWRMWYQCTTNRPKRYSKLEWIPSWQ